MEQCLAVWMLASSLPLFLLSKALSSLLKTSAMKRKARDQGSQVVMVTWWVIYVLLNGGTKWSATKGMPPSIFYDTYHYADLTISAYLSGKYATGVLITFFPTKP